MSVGRVTYAREPNTENVIFGQVLAVLIEKPLKRWKFTSESLSYL